MVSPVLYEHYYDGAFLVSEAEAHRSRDAGVIANTGTTNLLLDAGMVLCQNAFGSITATAKSGGNTGNGGVTATSVAAGAEVGNYLVTMTAATLFEVFNPAGQELENGIVGTAYTDEIGFKVTAGSTAFVAGDGFTLALAAGSGQWSPYTSSSIAQAPMGILFNRTAVPASGTKDVAVVTREAQVNREELVWDSSIAAAGGISSSAGTNTGNGTIGSLSIISPGTLTGGVEPFVPAGTYTITAIDSNVFAVADPTGEDLPFAFVGTAYTDEIGFTLTQGGTLFAAGDSFLVTVTESGQTAALAVLAGQQIIAR